MAHGLIAKLSDEQANQRLHESKLVGMCWHTYKRNLYSCDSCQHTPRSFSGDNPDYSNDWNAVIPVFQSLEGEQVAMIRDESDQCNPDRVIYECFRIKKPRYLVNVLLQLCEEAK